MLKAILIRGALAALPFVAWFLWAAWARRTGRQMGATPWPWLVGAGGVLVALSLMATAAFHSDNRDLRYVPAETRADGSVTEGHFEPR
ncbi:MAG: hypothetical protein GC203_22960 [Phenylobacterium sp.]|uniref:hypothetical protein n=1 Tax=Phenylobacterium sp. TaxID=1871053 RepID=UPI0025F1A3AF|nr:hypothetical protein [Phenylobacterium sp.]MBI1200734.1 hypothetical protein [Phenylobacterium sp.]